MAKKPRAARSRLRAASKVQERGLATTAQELLDHPEQVVPRCEGHRSHFKRDTKGVQRVWEHRDDLDKLASLAKRGPPLARAYAATLVAAFQGEEEGAKLIMLQVPTPFGVVPVVSRGKARAAHLVSMQNHTDRKLRLVGLLELVKKKKLHFFSMPDGGVVCTGREPAPPKAFIEHEARELGLLRDPEGWGCPHAVNAEERLTVRWKAAGLTMRRCGACAGERNTLGVFVTHAAGPRLAEGFEVRVDLAPLPLAGSRPVDLPPSADLDPVALERYQKGELSDLGLLEAQRAARLGHVAKLDGPLYVHGGVSYGADLEEFLAALKPTPVEDRALRAALADWKRPVVLEKGSAARLLADLWPERGLAALEAVAGNVEVAKTLYAEHDVSARGVGPSLAKAQARGSRVATDSALPVYRDLPPGPRLADAVARAYRAQGRPAAVAVLEGASPSEPKSVVHALELALGAGASKQWKYNPTELDLARQLESQAKVLLDAPAERYHEALQALAKALGFPDELKRL